MVRGAARATTLAERMALFVCMVCAVCLACVGARPGTEIALAEPPAAAETLSCEGDDDDADVAAPLPGTRLAPWRLKPRIPDDDGDADADADALPRPGSGLAVHSLSSGAAVLRQSARACIAQTLLAAVLPRGPTSTH